MIKDVITKVIPHEPSWRWMMFIWVVLLTAAGAWTLGIGPVPGSPILANTKAVEEVQAEVESVKKTISCSNLKSDIEKNRDDLYQIEREIERAEQDDETVTERVLSRRNELRNTLSDNEDRFRELGCNTV